MYAYQSTELVTGPQKPSLLILELEEDVLNNGAEGRKTRRLYVNLIFHGRLQ